MRGRSVGCDRALPLGRVARAACPRSNFSEGVLTPLSSDGADEQVKHSKAQGPRLTHLYNDTNERLLQKKSLPPVTTCEPTPYDPSETGEGGHALR